MLYNYVKGGGGCIWGMLDCQSKPQLSGSPAPYLEILDFQHPLKLCSRIPRVFFYTHANYISALCKRSLSIQPWFPFPWGKPSSLPCALWPVFKSNGWKGGGVSESPTPSPPPDMDNLPLRWFRNTFEFYLLNCKYVMQFENQSCSVYVCSNIRFLSSDLLYVSEVVFICIFYNKYIVMLVFECALCITICVFGFTYILVFVI